MSLGPREPRSLLDRVERLLGRSRRVLAPLARPGYFSRRAPAAPPRRVLLIAGHWLGDTFWASQVVPTLEERLGAELWVATKARAQALWEGLVPRERVVVVEHVVSDRRREAFSWRGLLGEGRRLRALRADLVLDLMGNRYSALLSFLARPGRAYGCDRSELSWLYSRPTAPFAPGQHLALRPWVALEQALEGATAALEVLLRPRLLGPPSAPLEPTCARLGLEPGAAFAVLAPGAGWANKRWPAARFAALARALSERGLEPLVVGSAGERALLEEVGAGAPGARALPGLPLDETRLLLERARLVVANDSGLGHLAAAAGVPVVSLFSSTNPALYRPLGPRVRVLRGECPARPEGAQAHCHGRAEHACPPSCWDALSVARVLAACDEAQAQA
ncbi:MAG: glycosyltransferase family 9 protein [Planctomycetota bacterium]